MLIYDLVLVDTTDPGTAEAYVQVFANDRADALAQARDLGWPLRRTRASRTRFGR